MRVKRTWLAKNSEPDKDFIDFCSSDRILAVLLKNRGIDTKEKAQAFLNPLKVKLVSPDVFTDMEKAAERIKSAVDLQENITVYGDFDADGITSTAILYLTLLKIGAKVDYYLPDRAIESHGLNTKALVNIIAKRKSKLIITVDCGISNLQEVKFANGFKSDVIITDHHEAPEVLPEAYAILNPKARNSLISDLTVEELQSLSYLAGVGVAFKLCCKLLEMYNLESFVHEILPLAAIGTVGDVVELIGENRSLVAMGLELIKNGRHKGVQKLIESAGYTDKVNLTSETVAFGIVPRINAAGRLDAPHTALNVLISQDECEIETGVKNLNDLNSLRQQLCDETFKQAKEMYEEDKSSNEKSIILLNDNWHVGIIGIVASKLAETYNKPVFLMTKDSINDNIIRCSCRSIPQINIFDVLSHHKDLFAGFGGHKMAAGFSFDENKIKFAVFKSLLVKTIDEVTEEIDFSNINLYADMIVEPEEISEKTIENIARLQPFGSGNEAPLFIAEHLSLKDYKLMGQQNNHLKISAEKNGVNVECIKWNTPDFNLPQNSEFDILFYPQLNEFNGNKKIQYVVSDIHSELLRDDGIQIKILDHRNKFNILPQVLDFVASSRKKTGIYAYNTKLIKQLEQNETALKICFSCSDIPFGIEQLMFFEPPVNKTDFVNIIKKTGAKIIHLMNFFSAEISLKTLISTLSGMLKYSLNNLNGNIETEKLAKALCIDIETIANLLSMFEEAGMTQFVQTSENSYKIKSLHPIEYSKIMQSSSYSIIEDQIREINEFKGFYLNSTVDEIKEFLLREI